MAERAEEIKRLKNHLSDVARRRANIEENYRKQRDNLNAEEQSIKAKLYDLMTSEK